MKNLVTIFSVLFGTFSAWAQPVSDSITMGQFYVNQIFYSLENGEVANEDNTNWDLAFTTHGNGAAGSAIWINEFNTVLWKYPGDTSNWSGFDTTGHENWERLLNSDTTWTNGAFNKYRGAAGMFDMGWGILNPSNNYWTFGDSLYLLRLNDGSFRKLWIVSLKTGVWEYKYANIDGSNEQVFTIDKSVYPKRNFVYHSVLNDQIVDREPDNDTWDITFTKHVDYLNPPGMYQSMTSVFSNRGVYTAKSHETDYAAASVSTSPQTAYTDRIDNIGREWKKYSSSSGWITYDSIAYFLYVNDSTDWYRMVFTGFEGMGTGKAIFETEELFTVSVEEPEQKMTWSLYPNPAAENVTILMDNSLQGTVNMQIMDITGKIVWNNSFGLNSGVTQKQVNISHLNSGVYFVVLSNSNLKTMQKLIVE